jgi:hypothetical protein
MLQWVRSQGCPWDEGTCSAAARSGNLEMLKWLHNAGCPLDEYTLEAAATEGNLEIMQWLETMLETLHLFQYR